MSMSFGYSNCNKTRYVVERFFAWLKYGFHRMGIRYERIADNYLGFLNIASIMMY
ncbi:MAG: transposase [Thaumarchaeota archaeon]|nr:transposase [Nitrososphaerota archaeon]